CSWKRVAISPLGSKMLGWMLGWMPAEAAVKGVRGGARVLDVDADHLRLRMGLLEVREGARFRVAAGAPGRPHVEHDRLSRVGGQTDCSAADRVGAAQLERRAAGASACCCCPG